MGFEYIWIVRHCYLAERFKLEASELENLCVSDYFDREKKIDRIFLVKNNSAEKTIDKK